jgi:hypothetical protein
MITDASLLRNVLAIVMLTIITFDCLHAAQSEPHLLPIQPNFDTLPPYGRTYAQTCEKLLFPASSWTIRYFQVIGDPPYDTGLMIYRKPVGSYWLMIKQARPSIGDIVMNAFYKRVELQSSLASIKIETSNREVPDDVAVEMHKLWLTLLQQTRPREKVDKTYYIHPTKVIFWARDHAITLSGKYPPDAAESRIFTSVEAIVDDLVKSCDMSDTDRIPLLRVAGKRARHLREALSSR